MGVGADPDAHCELEDARSWTGGHADALSWTQGYTDTETHQHGRSHRFGHPDAVR